MKIFNTHILNNRQRWYRALIYSILGTIISIIACVFAQRFLHVRTSLFYILAAYFLSWLILESGHGVQKKFSVLAAICTFVVIFLSDMFTIFGMSAFFDLGHALLFTFSTYTSMDLNSLLALFIKVGAIYVAYGRARVL